MVKVGYGESREGCERNEGRDSGGRTKQRRAARNSASLRVIYDWQKERGEAIPLSGRAESAALRRARSSLPSDSEPQIAGSPAGHGHGHDAAVTVTARRRGGEAERAFM